jgi:hypothetical protein
MRRLKPLTGCENTTTMGFNDRKTNKQTNNLRAGMIIKHRGKLKFYLYRLKPEIDDGLRSTVNFVSKVKVNDKSLSVKCSSFITLNYNYR